MRTNQFIKKKDIELPEWVSSNQLTGNGSALRREKKVATIAEDLDSIILNMGIKLNIFTKDDVT